MTTAGSPADPRLGRRFVGHDPRSLRFGTRPLLDARRLLDQDRYWLMPAGGSYPLDQGAEPSCTGFGSAHEYVLGPVQVPGIDAAFARARYQRNVEVDRAAGRFFDGGATVLATMDAAKADGLITGYAWNFGLLDTIDTLVNIGPVCLGTDWPQSMFEPDGDGLLTVAGQSAGGHFWVLAGRVREHPRWGPGCWMVQSWGRWGVGVSQLGLRTGCGFVRDADLERLLADSGESVVMRDFFDQPPIVDPATAPFFAEHGSRVFHDRHCRKSRDVGYAMFGDAVATGLRPCRVCRPGGS